MIESLPSISQQEWRGLHPQKFSGGRKHISPNDTLTMAETGPLPVRGRKHFEMKYDVPRQYRSTLKIFSQKYEHFVDGVTTDPKDGGRLNYVPPRSRYRPEKLKLNRNNSTDRKIEAQLHSLVATKNSNKEPATTGRPQTTVKGLELLEQLTKQQDSAKFERNVRSRPDTLNEKSKSVGLNSQAANKLRKQLLRTSTLNSAAAGKNSKNVPWVEREKQEAVNEDVRGVRDLTKWESTILKAANGGGREELDPKIRASGLYNRPSLYSAKPHSLGPALQR